MRIIFVFIVICLVITACTKQTSDEASSRMINYSLAIQFDSIFCDKKFIVAHLKNECVQNNQDDIPHLYKRMIDDFYAIDIAPGKIYPYSGFDSIVLYHPNIRENCIGFRRIVKLKNEKVQLLLKVLHNPLYFAWGECGTPVEEFRFVFYDNDSIVQTQWFHVIDRL